MGGEPVWKLCRRRDQVMEEREEGRQSGQGPAFPASMFPPLTFTPLDIQKHPPLAEFFSEGQGSFIPRPSLAQLCISKLHRLSPFYR